MWALFSSYLKSSWLVILQWLAGLAGVLMLVAKIRQDGERKVEQADTKETFNQIKVAQDAQAELDAMADSDRDSLRDKWTQ